MLRAGPRGLVHPEDLLRDLISGEREFFIDNLLVRIHLIIWWTGLAPWEFEFSFPGSLTSTFLVWRGLVHPEDLLRDLISGELGGSHFW